MRRTFKGFFTGRYLFDSVDRLLRSPPRRLRAAQAEDGGVCQRRFQYRHLCDSAHRMPNRNYGAGAAFYYDQDGIPTGLL